MRSSCFKAFIVALLLTVLGGHSALAGSLLRVFYDGIPGVAVTNLTQATVTSTASPAFGQLVFPAGPNADGSPLSSETLTQFLEGLPTTGNGSDNYGSYIRGYLEAPANGAYTFYIASDDNSELWLSTNSSAANKVLIAKVDSTVSGGWANPREYTKGAAQKSAAINLVVGQSYYFEVLHKEGGGGDSVSVAWLMPGQTGAPTAPIPGLYFQGYPVASKIDPSFTRQPANITVIEGQPVTFSADVNASGPASYEWLRNGAVIPGANLSFYTLPGVAKLTDSGANFSLVVGNANGYIVSAAATLTVLADTVPLTLVSASSVGTPYQVKVKFSKPVASASATLTSNYALDNGATLFSAVMGSTPDTVLLTTTSTSFMVPLKTYNLTVNNLRDLATTPNVIAANSQTNFVAVDGWVSVAMFLGAGSGADLGALTNLAAYKNNTPTYIEFASTTEVPQTGGVSPGIDSYGRKMSGYLVPPVTGNYKFGISSDDGSALWLSSDDKPANKSAKPIAQVGILGNTSYNGSTGFRQFNTSTTDAKYTNQISTNITLTAGKAYYFEVLHKEGGGGDHVSLAWQKPGDAALTSGNLPIPSDYISSMATTGGVLIVNQPATQPVKENAPTTFTVGGYGVTGYPPYYYQWYRNGQPIAGATNYTYTMARVSITNASDYFNVVVTNSFSSTSSQYAGLLELIDTQAPTVFASAIDTNIVAAAFSEGMDPVAATNLANYTFYAPDGSLLTPTAVALTANTAYPYGSTVKFTMPTNIRMDAQYEVVIQNIRDQAAAANMMDRTNFVFLGALRLNNTQNGGVLVQSGKLTMVAGGADIWDATDRCMFNYQTINGDFDIKVRLESLDRANVWSKAGLMVRDGILFGGTNRSITALVTAPTTVADNFQIGGGVGLVTNGVYTFQWRGTNNTGTASSSNDGPGRPSASYPNNWIRMQRVGSVFYSYRSTNGLDWLAYWSLDTATWATPMPALLYVGVAATSHDTGLLTKAVISNYGTVPRSPLAIVTQPADVYRLQDQTATFTVAVTGSTPYYYRWQSFARSLWSDVAGATNATYTTGLLKYSTDNNKQIRCLVTNPYDSVGVTSSNAVITINPDFGKPTIASMTGDTTMGRLVINFSETVTAASATNLANYTASGGLIISNIVLGPGLTNVILSTSLQGPGSNYTITITNVSDLVGNLVAANTKKVVSGWIFATNYLAREYYANITGTAVTNLTATDKFKNRQPDSISLIMREFRAPSDVADNYGQRVYGYLLAPETGNYNFFISADDGSEFWLSTDENPANTVKIVGSIGNGSAKSTTAVALTQGQRYYMEALHKEGGGGDNLSLTMFVPSTPVTCSGENLPNEGAAKAFDNNSSTKWLVRTTNGWIQYMYAANVTKIVTTYTLVSANDSPARDPKNWTLFGVKADSTLDLLDTQTGQTFASRFATNAYFFFNTNAYRGYRLQVDANSGDSLTQLADISLYDATGQPTTSLVSVPVMTGDNFGLWVNPDLSIIDITAVPASQTNYENRIITFEVQATGTSQYGPGLSYQWQTNGVNVPGATSSKLTTPMLTLADNGTKYTCFLTVPGRTVRLDDAVLTVLPDTSAPVLQMVNALAGNAEVQLSFDEFLDRTTATNMNNYGVSGTVVDGVEMLADNKTVIVYVRWLGGNTVTASARGLKDLKGNTMTTPQVMSGFVSSLAAMDIGTQDTNTWLYTDPIVRGHTLVLNQTDYKILGGGSDIHGNTDAFQFAFESKTGDFDVQVQLVNMDPISRWSKAGLMVREKLIPTSRNLFIATMPPPLTAVDGTGLGANNFEVDYRDVEGGGTALWPNTSNGSDIVYPNNWQRLIRMGNTFAALRSSNGVDWVVMSVNQFTYPAKVFVGMAVSARSNDPTRGMYATFQNYGLGQTTPLSIVTDPQSVTVLQGDTATLTVMVAGTPPYYYQWLKNGAAITNATNSTYTTAPLLYATDNNTRFSLVVSNLTGAAVTSAEATVSVNSDFAKPTVTKVVGSDTLDKVTVTFSEPVSDATATALGNYVFSGGVTATGATLSNGTNLVLTTAGQTGGTGYTLTITNVTDIAGNKIAANTKKNFSAWVFAMGFIKREIATNITSLAAAKTMTGGVVSYITTTFESPSQGTIDYGLKMSGFLVAPETGTYQFYAYSDDDCAAYISTDENPANVGAQPVISQGGWNNVRNWLGDAFQWTTNTVPLPRVIGTPVPLVGGARYYFVGYMHNGSGGDYFGVNWKKPSDATEPANDTPGISASYFGGMVNPDNSKITFATYPESVTVQQSLPATFTVSATGTWDGGTNIAYQWQKNGVDIAGATSDTLTIASAQMADNNAQITCQASVPGKSAVTPAATLTVIPDLIPPSVVSVAGLAGNGQVFITFDAPVDPVTALNLNNYGVSGGYVTDASLSPDGKTVILTVTGLVGPNAYVAVTRVKDMAGNALPAPVVMSMPVSRLTARDIGLQDTNTWQFTDPIERGYTTPLSATDFDIVGNGHDIWDNADGFQFAYEEKTGDFDVAVQVTHLDFKSNWSKAGVMARETLTADSRHLIVDLMPTQGANAYEVNTRPATGATTVGSWPGGSSTNTAGVDFSKAWIRVKRAGDTFSAFRSTNGVDWVLMQQSVCTGTNLYPAKIYLGLAVTSHNNVVGQSALAQFRNYHSLLTGSPNRPAELVVVDLPVLQINRVGETVVLSWKNNDTTTSFSLVSKDSVISSWRPVVQIPVPEGDTFTVTVPAADYQLFRLQKK